MTTGKVFLEGTRGRRETAVSCAICIVVAGTGISRNKNPPLPVYRNRMCRIICFTTQKRSTQQRGKIIRKFSNQACLRPRDRFWDIPVPKIDSAFDNLLVPQTSWSPSTAQQLRKLVAAPYLAPI
ncbi:hypothetical protein [Thiolapillus sp.]|uniref:hypothetical protein n=1 Tax=Thiolapillus sp. TaxID=2017437 RepID=UPI003AF9F83B